MSGDVLGLVVVGVGIAGGVRIKDILKESTSEKPFLPNVKLVGFVSRRQLTIEGAQQLTMEEALSRHDVHALLICTENEQHEKLARQAIEAGKHVLVEYPLALTPDGAKALLKLAEEKGVICYEEDILLITEAHTKVKELVKEKGLKEMQRTIMGQPNGWIEDVQRSGSPFVSAISAIHQALELCGELTPVAATFDVSGPKSWKATAKMAGPKNESVSIEITRSPDIEGRKVTYSFTFGDGSVVNEKTYQPQGRPDPTKPGLFLRDLMNFVSFIRGQTDVKESNALTLKALDVAEKLYKLVQK